MLSSASSSVLGCAFKAHLFAQTNQAQLGGARHILKSKPFRAPDLFSPQIGSHVPCYQKAVILPKHLRFFKESHIEIRVEVNRFLSQNTCFCFGLTYFPGLFRIACLTKKGALTTISRSNLEMVQTCQIQLTRRV